MFGGVGICVKVHGTVSGSVEVHTPCHTSPVEVSSVTRRLASNTDSVASNTLVGPPTGCQKTLLPLLTFSDWLRGIWGEGQSGFGEAAVDELGVTLD
ncbi:hypothetical protein ACFY13_44095, partial [Streptomyces mirabilis]|uniref:hypothetical protein n=1 Tax=Streptomyces mirabilis TaxID=68239 RepID=UPI0036A908B3